VSRPVGAPPARSSGVPPPLVPPRGYASYTDLLVYEGDPPLVE
jgi:hypothetical protein